jgi:hypothetical protein
MLAAYVLPDPYCIKDAHGRTVGHHHVYRSKIRNRIVGDGNCVGRTLMSRIIAILIAKVRESPVAEFRLVR